MERRIKISVLNINIRKFLMMALGIFNINLLSLPSTFHDYRRMKRHLRPKTKLLAI